MNGFTAFRQSWQLIRKDWRYSLIYVLGTALSVALVTALSVYYLAKFVNLYPENCRDRLLVLDRTQYRNSEDRITYSTRCNPFLAELLREADLPEIEALTLADQAYWEQLPLQADGSAPLRVSTLYVEEAFWRIFSFRFTAGNRPAPADYDPARPGVVITQSLSRRLFGSDASVGKELKVPGRTLRVVGVVEDVPAVAAATDADIWLPLSLYAREFNPASPASGRVCYVLARSRTDFGIIRDKVNELAERYNQAWGAEAGYRIVTDSPDGRHLAETYPVFALYHPQQTLAVSLLVILLLFLVPAVNLAGMVSFRMEERLEEFGVRKAYGAPPRRLVGQILQENLLLTAFGGLIGYGLAWGVNALMEDWYVYAEDLVSADRVMPAESMLRADVFLLIFVSVLVLNVFSAWIPARRMSRRPAVDALNVKR